MPLSRADAVRTLLFASSAAGMLIAAPAAADPGTDPADPQDATNLGTVTVTGQAVRREPEHDFLVPNPRRDLVPDRAAPAALS